jgi:hypothetical protein
MGSKHMQQLGIYLIGHKAYLPVQAQFPSGIYADIDPVYATDLAAPDLMRAVQAVMAHGHPQLPEPTRDELRQRKDPVLAATKTLSWKELARRGASYSIAWTDSQIRLDMSRLDKKGRWEWDLQKVHLLPVDTPLEEIIDLILKDAAQRPELAAD